MTIDMLPDDVFLQIFACVLAYHMEGDSWYMRQWQRLVQVCQRWRHIIYASPRHLDLLLYCSEDGIPVKNLSCWPALPIAMCHRLPVDEADAITVLKHPDRVRRVEIYINKWDEWGKLAEAMQEPFPVLTHLVLSTSGFTNVVLHSGFLGGSAPCLRKVDLTGISFPELPTLLLSTRDLVYLRLNFIPPSGHFSPEAMIAGLAALTRLENLFIVFGRLPPQTEQKTEKRRRRPDPPSRVVLPALTHFRFGGRCEYLNDLVAEIDAPQLHSVDIQVDQFDFLPFPQLFQFIGRSENLSYRRAKLDFPNIYELKIELQVNLYRPEPQTHFCLYTPYDCSGTHVAHITFVLAQTFTICSDVEFLHIQVGDSHVGWDDNIDSTEWLEFFRLFPTVKTLHIHGMFAAQVARALEDVPREMVTNVLPSLHILILQSSDGEVVSAEQFVSLRRLYGRPVTFRDYPLNEMEKL